MNERDSRDQNLPEVRCPIPVPVTAVRQPSYHPQGIVGLHF